ncbi:MAG: hypothetical protein HQL21_09550 [Candidatus Omnitrophica bacterium]|nr:hypothetical protein [Candidatus Omnitrophota bacterium]
MLKRVFSGFMCFCFIWTNILGPGSVRAAEIFLPEPGTMLLTTPDYVPAMMRGLQVRVDNPLLFDFFIDTGNSGMKLNSPAFKDEAEKLIKYFLASLTVKEEDLWVNLSPYEKDRMITQELGATVLGRDMLAQDYVLKQLTASMIYPEKELGKAFWHKVYAQAKEQFGTTDIPVDTFNKVWITADKAKVLERNNAGYVIGAHLKVMLESDYVAQARDKRQETREAVSQDSQELAKQVVREIVLPAIEKEVNEGKNFSNLRQIFYAMILASWYKAALKDALLNQVYADKGKMDGVQSDDPAVKEKIYAQYLEAYKKGVFNYIREEADATTGEMLPRKYFSGGVRLIDSKKAPVQRARKLETGEKLGSTGELAMVAAKMDPTLDKKRKMTILVSPDFPKPQVEVFKNLFRNAVFVENLPVKAGDDALAWVTNVLVSAYGPYDVVLIDKNSYAASYSRRFSLKDKVITVEMIDAAGFNAQNNFDPQNILDLLEAWDVVKKDEGSNVQGRVIFGDPKWTPAQEQRELQAFLIKKLSEDPEPGIAPEVVAAQAGEIAGYIMDFLNGRKRVIKVFTNNITADEIKTGLMAVQAQVEKAMGQDGSMTRRSFLKLLGLATAAVTVLKPVVLFASDLFDYVYIKALPYIKLFQDNALTTGTADFPDVKGFTRSFRGDGPAGPLQLYGASSYDMAGLARIQLQHLSADSKRDTTILDTFVKNWKAENNKVFTFNNGYHDASGKAVNNLPYNMIRILGRDIPKWWEGWDWNVEQGGSAELITLATDAFRKTGNDDYRKFAKAMIDALLPLQDMDASKGTPGGFRFGPIGIAHDSGDRFYWNLKSTEKNQRIYSAIQNYNSVFDTDTDYVASLAAVKGWINSMYNKEEHLFRTAAQWNGTAWVTRTANEYFATDVTAMAPGFIFTDSNFGATQEERDLEIRAMVEQTETRTAFKNAAGMPIFFRFSGSQTGDYGSVEWTSQMAFFYLLAANFYDNLRIVYPAYQSNSIALDR